jgi:hypothetical protein
MGLRKLSFLLPIENIIVAHESSPIYEGHKDLTSFFLSSKISLAICINLKIQKSFVRLLE